MEFWNKVLEILILGNKEHRFNCDTLNAWWIDRFNPDNAFDYVIHTMIESGIIPVDEYKYKTIFHTHWRVILSTVYKKTYPEHHIETKSI
jgi:hypothetical protein